jgi:hypothetical protein
VFRFFCPMCGNKLKATSEMVGVSVQCAHCDRVIAVPEPDDRPTEEVRPKPIPDDGWAKTQEISRSALRKYHDSGDDSVNLVDLINEQVEQDSGLDLGNADALADLPKKSSPKASPSKVAVPVDPPPSPSKVAVPVDPPPSSEIARVAEPVTSTPEIPSEPNRYRAGMKLGNF